MTTTRKHKFRNRIPETERIDLVDLASKTLFTDEAKEALDYLTETRKITEDVLRDFRVGYVPHYVKNIHGDFHEFAGRIVLPVYDQYDELVALSSRDWRENAFMKFWHEQYIKSNYLYGLNVAKQYILKSKKAIIVEGELDVLTSHRFGFKMTVGLMGSALGLKQIAMLSRYCQNIFLVLDADLAGQEATKKVKNADMLKDARRGSLAFCTGINLIPVYLSKYHCLGKIDPDDFLNEYGKEEYVKCLKDAAEGILA